MPDVITDNIDLWSSALLTKSTAGRGSNGRLEAYGIKKLRELILELAVRGMLVPQDPKDEPASVLLGKIAKESKLLKKSFPDIGNNEKTFGLPQGWQWVRFGTVALHNSGKTLDRGRNTGQLRDYITTSNLYWGRFDLNNVRQMPIEDEQLEKCTARKGDLLICEGGEAGRAAVWPYKHEVCFQNHVHRARFYGGIDPYYVYRYFEKLNATGEIDLHRKGVGISNMSSKALTLIVLPLPPLAEQHRIVAKVDELMALCDQLEQQQTSNIEAHQTLVETLLGTLTNVESQEEFAEAWTRIANHFDTLFTTEQSIDHLKQAVLQLAVMGKLVPQDPNASPARMLLKEISIEKERMIKASAIRSQKPLPEITEGEKPFILAVGWEWAKCQDICYKITDGEHATPSRSESGHYLLSARNVTNEGILLDDVDYVPSDEFERIRNRCDPNTGDILISCSGSVGRVALVDKDNAYSMVRSAAMIRPDKDRLLKEYIVYALRSPYLQSQMTARSKQTAQANLFLGAISNLVLAIPPLAEQHRIVAKVDELMTLCDSLKARLAAAQTTQVHLADTIVEQAVT